MIERPELNENLDSKTFLNYYYLKEELAAFCRRSGLPSSGPSLGFSTIIFRDLF